MSLDSADTESTSERNAPPAYSGERSVVDNVLISNALRQTLILFVLFLSPDTLIEQSYSALPLYLFLVELRFFLLAEITHGRCKDAHYMLCAKLPALSFSKTPAEVKKVEIAHTHHLS